MRNLLLSVLCLVTATYAGPWDKWIGLVPSTTVLIRNPVVPPLYPVPIRNLQQNTLVCTFRLSNITGTLLGQVTSSTVNLTVLDVMISYNMLYRSILINNVTNSTFSLVLRNYSVNAADTVNVIETVTNSTVTLSYSNSLWQTNFGSDGVSIFGKVSNSRLDRVSLGVTYSIASDRPFGQCVTGILFGEVDGNVSVGAGLISVMVRYSGTFDDMPRFALGLLVSRMLPGATLQLGNIANGSTLLIVVRKESVETGDVLLFGRSIPSRHIRDVALERMMGTTFVTDMARIFPEDGDDQRLAEFTTVIKGNQNVMDRLYNYNLFLNSTTPQQHYNDLVRDLNLDPKYFRINVVLVGTQYIEVQRGCGFLAPA